MEPQPIFAQVRAVFFDLDDTLCAYWEAAKAGLKAAFEEVSVPGFSIEQVSEAWAKEFRRFSHELKTSHWYEIYLQQGGVTRVQMMNEALLSLGLDAPELAWRLGEAYGRERDARLRLFAEAREVLEALKPHYPLGLITNGPADVQRQEIATLGIGDLFDHVFIEGEMGVGKPHLSVMRRAESAVGLPGEQILFVGNSYAHDMVPAMEAGWRTVWVRRATDVAPSSRTGKPEERPDGSLPPDAETGDLRELLDLLGLTQPAR